VGPAPGQHDSGDGRHDLVGDGKQNSRLPDETHHHQGEGGVELEFP
jgi:hypothetical protein